MKPEDHGKKAGFVVTRDHPEVRTILGEFGGLNGDAVERAVATATAPEVDGEVGEEDEPIAKAATATAAATGAAATGATTPAVPRKRTRRGSRGGRRRGGRGRTKPTAAGTGTEAAD